MSESKNKIPELYGKITELHTEIEDLKFRLNSMENHEVELDKVRKQLSEAIDVIKFYGSVNHWCNSNEFNSACKDFDEVEGYPNLYQGGKKARDFLKSLEEK